MLHDKGTYSVSRFSIVQNIEMSYLYQSHLLKLVSGGIKEDCKTEFITFRMFGAISVKLRRLYERERAYFNYLAFMAQYEFIANGAICLKFKRFIFHNFLENT